MSKIRDALEKSRAQGGNSGTAAPRQGEGSMRVAPAPQTNALVVMSESRLLAPEALESRHIVHPRLQDRGVLDGFRGLRSTLLRKVNGHANLVCVTSVWPQDHGGLVAANLATVIAADESRSALLIDCNLARPSVGRLFEMGDGPGLSDYLADEKVDVTQVIRPVGIRRLRAIAAGHADPQGDCFLFRRMKDLVAEIRARYDDRMIILNAPPVRACADATILAEQSDYVVLAVPYGRVTMAEISDAARAVGAAKVAGVVFFDEPRVPSIGPGELLREAIRQLAHPVAFFRRLVGAPVAN